MTMRLRWFGMALTGALLLALAAGCAKKVPITAEPSDQKTTMTTPAVSAEELARQERERRQAIAERERQAKMQSMRRGEFEREAQEKQLQEEFLNQDIHFAFDSSALSEEARAILDRKAAWLQSHANVNVQVEGHCDERGTTEYNLALGERRANASKRYVMAHGIAPERLTTISYGEESPLDPGHNQEAWARNRRAHFVITRQ